MFINQENKALSVKSMSHIVTMKEKEKSLILILKRHQKHRLEKT